MSFFEELKRRNVIWAGLRFGDSDLICPPQTAGK